MDKQAPQLDKSKLTTDQLAQLEEYEATQKQLTQLEDIANMAHEAINLLDEQKKTGTKTVSDFGALLVDIRESLTLLNDKQAPVMPDYAKPVVEALSKLETALTASTQVKPQVNVAAPNVNVAPTPIDLSGVEKALSAIPKAFKQAISLIPKVDIPKTDFQPLLDAWEGISEQLVSIENATRMKPLPGSIQINNTAANPVPITGDITTTVDTTGLASDTNQTSGLQKTQIVDSGGEVATVTGGKLDVNATASLAGTSLPIVGASSAVGVAIVDSSGNQISSFGGGTQYTDAGTPPTHPIGGTLEWNNAGTWATVGSASPLPVSLASVPSHAVTNVGTFAVQAAQSGTWNIGTVTTLSGITNALPAGSNVIGHVITDTGSTTAVTGTVTISGAVTEATLDAAIISQEATTLGVKGLTAFGAVTTNAPTYTTAKSDALSLDTSGLLRVSLKDSPANTNKFLVTADAITFASPQHIVVDSGTISTITNVVHIDDNSGSLTVDGTITANAGTNLNTSALALDATLTGVIRAEDTASADTDKGIGALAIRKATPANTSGTDGDYEFLQMSGGRLWASATIDTSLPAGTNVIGHVITDTGSTTAVTGTVTISGTVTTTPPSNASTNIAQINGVTPLMGNGVTGTGSQRVTIASDNTAFSVNSTLSVETTKVIGVVRTADGSGNLLTSTGNALDINIKSGNPTTMTVTQGTGTNLHTVLDSGTITAVTAITNALPAGTNVIGHVISDLGSVVTLKNSLGAEIGTRNNPIVIDDSEGDISTIFGQPVISTAPGIQLNSLAGPTGDPIDTVGDSLAVAFKNPQQVSLSNRSRKDDAYLTLTSSTTETTLIPLNQGLLDIYGIVAINTSAAATQVDFRDTTGGTVRFSIYIPAGETRGFALTESAAYKQRTKLSNWTAKCGTSVASVIISALYVVN